MTRARKGRKAAARETTTPKAKHASRGRGEREQLVKRIADALHISEAEAELRALRELAERVAPEQPNNDRPHSPEFP